MSPRRAGIRCPPVLSRCHHGPVIESWSTPGQLAAKTAEFEAALASHWERPTAWGLMHDDADGRIVVDRTEAGIQLDLLALLVMATTIGDCCGTYVARIDAAQLDMAIAMLAPAEACTEYKLSNLRTWRYLRDEIGEDGAAVAVFTRAVDITDPDVQDPYLAALSAEIHRGRQENPDGSTTLWRPVGAAELELLRAADMRAWPPRLADQPLFYPVLSEAYARQIAAEWNVPLSGSGYVTRFRLATSFARRYPTCQAGGRDKLELWIPAGDLAELNHRLIGPIEVVEEL
jgi:hypothetical protein